MRSWSFYISLGRFVAKTTLFWPKTFNPSWLRCFRSFNWGGIIVIIAWTKLVISLYFFFITRRDHLIMKVLFWKVFRLDKIIRSWTNCNCSLRSSNYIPLDFRIKHTFVITFNFICFRFFIWVSMMKACVPNAYLI